NFWMTQPHHFADANLESARQLISAIAPITNTITLLYAAGDRNHKMAQALQSQWKEVLGITVELEAEETKVYFSRISNQDYQLSIGSWIADFADPINFLDVFKTKSVGTNNTHWENVVYEQLLDQSNQTLDVNQRQALLCKAEEILISEMPVIPLFTYSLLYVKNEKLKNVTISSMGSLDFTHAYLEE
ncbi:MAG: peptide ABC transporter substrate-binding protein, partial [Chlamydiia bacterium]|nr:peptide ABC transporter substrate-binding protein [Chlamydiia bacterium]